MSLVTREFHTQKSRQRRLNNAEFKPRNYCVKEVNSTIPAKTINTYLMPIVCEMNPPAIGPTAGAINLKHEASYNNHLFILTC